MYQKQRKKTNKRVSKSSNNKITKKDKFNGILAIIFVVITAFLLLLPKFVLGDKEKLQLELREFNGSRKVTLATGL